MSDQRSLAILQPIICMTLSMIQVFQLRMQLMQPAVAIQDILALDCLIQQVLNTFVIIFPLVFAFNEFEIMSDVYMQYV